MTTRHLTVAIGRPADDVYRYAANPVHLPEWASGLARQPVENVDGRFLVASPMGPVTVEFVGPNPFGVLDHVVTLPSGERVVNPVRVIPDGDNACEVVFTIRQRQMSDEQFDADTDVVMADLDALKRIAENTDPNTRICTKDSTTKD